MVEAEFLGGHGRLLHAADTTVGNDAFDRAAVGIAQLPGVELGYTPGHIHRSLLQRFADTAPAPVDHGTNSDAGFQGFQVHIFQV